MSHTRRDEELARTFLRDAAERSALAGRDVIAGAQVRLAYHDPDDGWWFSSGGDEADEGLGVVCLPCLLHDDPDLVELANLPLNWIARRDDDDVTWTREPRPEDWGPWESPE